MNIIINIIIKIMISINFSLYYSILTSLFFPLNLTINVNGIFILCKKRYINNLKEKRINTNLREII